jgi:fatty-acid desaturase
MLNVTQRILLFHHLAIIAGIMYYGFNIYYALIILVCSIAWAYFVGHKGMHIYLAHHEYKDNLKSYMYTIGALVSGVGSPMMFSVAHRQHHKYPDTEKDPHSPAHIGWFNVWVLNYNSQYISVKLIKDFLKSKFQVFMNRHWGKLTVLMITILALIDPRLVCFVVSPFSVYTFHGASAINVFGHLHGEPRDSKEVLFWNPWDTKHKEHHEWR